MWKSEMELIKYLRYNTLTAVNKLREDFFLQDYTFDNVGELVTKTKAGDKEAFSEIVKLYMKKAYFIALGIVGNEQDAYDISQDAFIKAYKSIKSFDSTKDFFPWFYKIVRNVAIDYINKRKKNNEVDLDTAIFKISENSHLPFEEREELKKCIFSLPQEHREVIVLRFFHGYSYKEIADILDKPIGSVMSSLHYAKGKMKKFLVGGKK
jgi:RNA polymerase sigma-70 factor (ECF subfamily)